MRLRRREADAVSAFRAAAAARIDARFPGLAAERDALAAAALERAAKDSEDPNAPPTTIEAAGTRYGFLLAAEAVREAALARLRGDPGAPAARLLFARLASLQPSARSLARLAFVQHVPFAEAIPRLGLDGPKLGGELTSLRRLFDAGAQTPPAADLPAYVRLPFLVTGHLAPDDALRVREHLGQSEACRRAYRELDAIHATFARHGPALGEPHPDPTVLGALADRTQLSGERRDSVAEHLRFCAGCEAVLAALRATSPGGAEPTLGERLDAPAARRRLAAALVALSMGLPVGLHALARRAPPVEVGGAAGIDLGAPLSADPSRAPTEVALPRDGSLALSARVPLEPGVEFDLRLVRADGAEVHSEGGVPIERLDDRHGRVTLRVKAGSLSPGDHRLHLLRRFRGAGGEAADLAFPIRVVP